MPLSLFFGKVRIPGLFDSRRKNILTAGINPLTFELLQALEQLACIFVFQMLDFGDPKILKVSQRGRSHGDQV